MFVCVFFVEKKMKKSLNASRDSITIIYIVALLLIGGAVAGFVVLTNRMTYVGESRISTIDGVAQQNYIITPGSGVIITETETGIAIDTEVTSIVCNTTLSADCLPPSINATIALLEEQLSQLNVSSLATTVSAQGAQIATQQTAITAAQTAIGTMQSRVTQIALTNPIITDMIVASGNVTYVSFDGSSTPNILSGWGNASIYTRTMTLAPLGTNTSFIFIRLYPTQQGWTFHTTASSFYMYIDVSSFYAYPGGLGQSGQLTLIQTASTFAYSPACPTCTTTYYEVYVASQLLVQFNNVPIGQTFTFQVSETIDISLFIS